MKDLVERQFRNFERAFTFNTGPYEVHPNYISHCESATKWVKRSKQYKERAINSFCRLPLVYDVPDTAEKNKSEIMRMVIPLILITDDTEGKLSAPAPLSISWKDAALSGEIYEGMWNKASSLVANPDTITRAPGLASARMVYSSSNPKKPHLVTFYKSGKVTCDCQNCSIKHICAHILATAEKMKMLQSFMEWYKKEVSLWDLARSSGVPKNPGSKPQARRRSRNVLPQVKTTSNHLVSPPAKRPCPDYYNNPYPLYCAPMPFPYIPPPSPYVMPYDASSYYQYPSPMTPTYPSMSFNSPTARPLDRPTSLETIYFSTSFYMKKITARIKKCQGCKQLFSVSSRQPPNDLIVSRLECHPFVAPDGSVKVPGSPKNSHYHLAKECLTNTDPSFTPSMLFVPDDVKTSLSQQHKDFFIKEVWTSSVASFLCCCFFFCFRSIQLFGSLCTT